MVIDGFAPGDSFELFVDNAPTPWDSEFSIDGLFRGAKNDLFLSGGELHTFSLKVRAGSEPTGGPLGSTSLRLRRS